MSIINLGIPLEIPGIILYEKYSRFKLENGMPTEDAKYPVGFGSITPVFNTTLTLTSDTDGDFHGTRVEPNPPANHNVSTDGKTVTVEVPPGYQDYGDGIFRVELIKRQ